MNALIIFIKNPELGKVKTRLARTVGDVKALEIYLQLQEITHKTILEYAKEAPILPYLFYSNFIDSDDKWPNDFYVKKVQTGADLGERMLHAFQDVLKKHQKACIIGSDCPTLSASIISQAFESLEDNAYCIGPSVDGGYYLLGINQTVETDIDFLFENIAWSTENVLPETVKRIGENNQKYVLLPTLNDIDDEEDWQQYLSHA